MRMRRRWLAVCALALVATSASSFADDKPGAAAKAEGMQSIGLGRLTEASRALEALRALPAIPRTQRRIERLAGEIALERGDRAGVDLIRKAAAKTTNWDLNDSLAYALERTGGNKGQAAKLLNLKRTTLVEKLKRLSR